MSRPQQSLAQRYKISAHLQAGISKRRIANMIHVHHSTVCREIQRNSLDDKYNPETAERMSKDRRIQARKNRKISKETWRLVEKLLRLDFSPEQISGLFGRSGVQLISHESVYR